MNDPVITKPAAEPDRVDPYSQAGQEVLTGDVLPDLWARSLAKADLGELAVKAEYVRLRVEQLSAVDERIIAGSAALELTDEPPNKVESDISGEDPESTFNFTAAELAVYGFHQVDVLEEALRNGDPDTLYAIRNTIGRKIGRIAGTDDERVFLEAFCEQLRAHLSDPT